MALERNTALQEALVAEMLPKPEYFEIPDPNTEEGTLRQYGYIIY